MKTISSPTTAVTMGLEGTLDMVNDITTPARLKTLSDAGLTIEQTPGFHLCRWAINMRDVKPESSKVYWPYRYNPGDTNYPLNVTAVRQAIHFLTDKSIIYTVLGAIVQEAFSAVPPANAKWYYSGIGLWPFDPTTARTLLDGLQCAWKFDNGIYVPDPSKWNPGDAGWPGTHYPADYIPLRTLWAMYPSASIAPTTDQICAGMVDTWNSYLNSWAGTVGVAYIAKDAVIYDPLIYVGYYNRDFDLWFLCYGLSPDIDYLYYCFHSDNDIVGGDNLQGLRDPYVDAELFKVMFWRDPITNDPLTDAEVWEASKNAQVAMFDYTDPDALVPWIPVYHRKYTAAIRKNLADPGTATNKPANVTNYIMSPGFATYPSQATCQWAYTHIHDNEGGQEYGGTVQWHCTGDPVSLNPVLAVWVYEATIINRYYDAGYQWHPKYHVELPWYVTGWEWEPWEVPGYVDHGMKITYYLRDDVLWQDGTPATAADAKWNYDYIAKMQFENWYAYWMYYITSSAPEPHKLVVYLSTTGIWYVHTFASSMFVFPPDMWQDKTTTAQAEAYKPWTLTHPAFTGTYPTWWPYAWPLTQAYGVGPFVLKNWDKTGLYADLYPNPIFWVNNTRVVTSVLASEKIEPGQSLEYHVNVENVDKYNVTGPITVKMYEDGGLVRTETLSIIEAFNNTILGQYSFGPLTCGTHTIKVIVTAAGQTFQYVHTVIVTLKEDINLDLVVDGSDEIVCTASFGSYPGHPAFDIIADLSNDGVIDGSDIIMVDLRFGWGCI